MIASNFKGGAVYLYTAPWQTSSSIWADDDRLLEFKNLDNMLLINLQIPMEVLSLQYWINSTALYETDY